MNASLGMDLIRSFFSVVDSFLYSFIAILYNLLLQISEQSIFSNGNIDEIAKRVYTFLGIVMLFKVTFSLINYIVNPDAITDKNNGAGNIVKNIIITLFLIIIVPYGFDFLYQAQSAILKDNILAGIVLGAKGDSTDAYLSGSKVIIDSSKCRDNPISSDQESNANDYIYTEVANTGDFLALVAFRPFYQVYDEQIDNVKNSSSFVSTTVKSYCTESTVKNLLQSQYYNAEDDVLNTGQYIIDYSFLLSTATGVVVMLLLLSFCMDVALRVIKLGFLEIIAPIPIISYIDPKSGKDGMFKKWFKEVISTWASLFIRLAIVYFAIYAIKLINESIDMNQDNSMWITLFLIIGALMFAKQAPKLIENIFGLKFDGMALNPIKKLQNETVGLGAAVGVGAAGAAVIGGGAANAWALHNNNAEALKKMKKDENYKNFSTRDKIEAFYANGGTGLFKGTGSILAGGASAGLRTFADSAKSGNKVNALKSIEKGITDSSTARTRRAAGYGIKSAIVDKATDMAHISQSYGTTSLLKNNKKAQEQKMNELIARNESLRDQAAYYKAQNPNSSLAYNEAGKVNFVVDEDGKQVREYVYKDYADYESKMLNKMENATGEELDRLNAVGMLSKEEFDRARAYDDEIESNRKAIDAAKKEISKIEENMKKDK